MSEKAISCGGYRIPVSKYAQFRDALSACNGTLDYVYTFRRNDFTTVGFSFDDMDDYKDWRERWASLNTDIKVVRRDANWRRLLRRLNLGFLEKRINAQEQP